VTIEGKPFDLAEAPKPLMLHFWATWCPTCRAEAGNIGRVAETHDVMTVAVKSGGPAKIREYLETNGLRFPVIDDRDGAIASRFGVQVFPTTVLVGKDGKVFWSETGYTSTWGLKLRLWLAGL
jgi:thiol-disulfide isomerase/thioredoxin